MNELSMTLTKTRNYKLQPFGRFWIKMNTSKQALANPKIINFNKLIFNHDNGMPYTKEQETEFCKFMKKNHTDFLTNGRNIYTRIGDSWVEVSHPKLEDYRRFLNDRNLEDCEESWNQYISNY